MPFWTRPLAARSGSIARVSEQTNETYQDRLWNFRVGLVDGGLYGSVLAIGILFAARPWWPEGTTGGWLSLALWLLCVAAFLALYVRVSVTRSGDQLVVRNPFRTVTVHRGAAWSPGRSQVWTGRSCVVIQADRWPQRVRVVALPSSDESFLTAR